MLDFPANVHGLYSRWLYFGPWLDGCVRLSSRQSEPYPGTTGYPLLRSATFIYAHLHRIALQRDVELKSTTQVIATAVVAGHACDSLGVVEPVDDSFGGLGLGWTWLIARMMSLQSDVQTPPRTLYMYLKKCTVVGSCHAVSYVKKGETHTPVRRRGDLLPPHLDDSNNSNKHIASDQRRTFMELLIEFQDVFYFSPNDITRTNIVTMECWFAIINKHVK